MSRVLVTGAAGFIGSTLCESLLKYGYSVIGLDNFLADSYSPAIKKSNIEYLSKLNGEFEFIEFDLRKDNLGRRDIFTVETVFHLAAMPGLPLSWTNTDLYVDCNIRATVNLVKLINIKALSNFVYASTSSVYGEFATGSEVSIPLPISPYGVTKLAAENYLQAIARTGDLPLTILRFFSVFGPRQRPDMAYHKLIQAIDSGSEFIVFGNGLQSRTNTYVGDLVEATIKISQLVPNSEIYNLGGNAEISLSQAIETVSTILKKPAKLIYAEKRLGDQIKTKANIDKAVSKIGKFNTTSFYDGLEAQIRWQKDK